MLVLPASGRGRWESGGRDASRCAIDPLAMT
jgi:hypothetical protein